MHKVPMKYLAALAVVLVLPFSSSAEVHKRGDRSCDVSKAEEYYRQDPEDLATKVLYAKCLVIKGDHATGLPELYHLADYQNSVSASFFLADYLETDGTFTFPPSSKHLDEAIKYYYRTLVLIDHIPGYPEPDYFFHEKYEQMHLHSVYRIVKLHVSKYDWGIIGDYLRHLYQSSSYQGDRDRDTYPEYNNVTLDSLDKAILHAKECTGLPKKPHFDSELYSAVVRACHLEGEQALALIPLEEERRRILLKTNCKDLNEADCPEYYETHREIRDVMIDYTSKIRVTFNPEESLTD